VTFAEPPALPPTGSDKQMDVDDTLPKSHGAPDGNLGRAAEECGGDFPYSHGEPSVIPIQIVRNQRPTFNVVVRTSYRDGQSTQSFAQASQATNTRLSPELYSTANPSGCDDDEEENESISSEPESPVIEIDLTPPPPASSTAEQQQPPPLLWQSAQQPTESLRHRRQSIS
jgi:hypothetical protein